MSKIAILTDSASDIAKELAEKYQIDVVSLTFTLNDKTYVDRQDITPDEYYEMMRSSEVVPTTAAVTPLQFCEQYCKYVDEGYTDALVVTLNSEGSSTYNNARMAVSMLNDERPGHSLKVHLVDSHTYSMDFGWPLVKAARKLRSGAELAPIIDELNSIYSRTEICLAAFSLKQMKKSGRISATVAFMGELLGLRPIISLNGGVSKVEAKVRGDAAVVPAMIKYCQSRVDMKEAEYCLGYTGGSSVEELKKQCKKAFGHEPALLFQLGCVISTHTGPDALAIVFEGQPRG